MGVLNRVWFSNGCGIVASTQKFLLLPLKLVHQSPVPRQFVIIFCQAASQLCQLVPLNFCLYMAERQLLVQGIHCNKSFLYLLRLPLTTSQRLTSLLLLLMLMVVLMVLVVVVVMLVVTIMCSGWTVDNPQARTAVKNGEGTAAVFMVTVGMFGMLSMVGMVMTKLSRVVVDGVEGRCLLLVDDCPSAVLVVVVVVVVVVLSFWIKMDCALNVLQLR